VIDAGQSPEDVLHSAIAALAPLLAEHAA
jgi:hypothetical protein